MQLEVLELTNFGCDPRSKERSKFGLEIRKVAEKKLGSFFDNKSKATLEISKT